MPIPRHFPKTGGKSDHSPPNGASSGANTPLAGRYVVSNKLGSGNFGTVYLVNDIKTGEKKVLKKINVGEIQPDETVEAVKEATLLAKLDHPAIVKFHDSFMDGDFFCIVTEYCEGGDLDHMIKQLKEAGKRLDESLIMDWFVQLTNAVRYIHDRRVLHRDLKTRNIFLKDNKIKLGDFGISRILIGTSDFATTFTGTPYYMSPEVLKHDGYNVKSDIWSLGAVLYELCTLEHAFTGQNLMAVMYKIVEGHPPRLPDHFTPSLRYLFSRMMDKIPSRRPSAVEILQEPYIKRHMESLSQKLTLTLTSKKTNPSEEAKAIAKALNQKHKKQLSQEDSDNDGPTERAMTPRERMLRRKSKLADKEAEKLKQAAAENYSENQRRYKERMHRTKKSKIVPPWVGEHPDVFDDPNFSITAIESSRGTELENGGVRRVSDGKGGPERLFGRGSDLIGGDEGVNSLNESFMEISIGVPIPSDYQLPESLGIMTESPNVQKSVDMIEDPIPEDPIAAETYYSQFDDFEMDVSSSDEGEDDYEAILDCIKEALDLEGPPLTGATAVVPQPPQSHDDLSPFSPLAREKRIVLLKQEAQRVLGVDVFQRVYEYLKIVREETGLVNEASVMVGLKNITDNTRDCFLVDQLVFLEKQAENSL